MKKTFIIAEAGVNHNGDLKTAFKLIDVAKESGADAVKFQTFKAKNIVSKSTEKADYQKKTTDKDETHYDMIKKLELSEEQHNDLIKYCKNKKIEFLSTPFDLDSIVLLRKLSIPIYKVPSGEITNYPYLKKIAQQGLPVIMSTGMSNLAEIEDALEVLLTEGLTRDKITILHCNSEYPTPKEDVNLKAMLTIKAAFPGIKVGYSDHTLGIEVPIAAVALGASVIEKHFTIDRTLPGPDHRASLEPDELKLMVESIRNIEKALGNGIKGVSSSEKNNKLISRKSIVANRDIKKGEVFTESNITAKRPGTGISPMRWNEVIGTVSRKDYQEDELI